MDTHVSRVMGVLTFCSVSDVGIGDGHFFNG
jgi:hypothetical protein